ncbi:DEAD/DEAH box helicase [Flavobacteriales bacterium]|nr:DEAD/DEAH box helicase [Flavobacteriales bacterium]
MATFKELGLSDEILKALTGLGFETPSEIQEQAIPQLISGIQDFIGLAQTGTGKTAAFGLPLLERIDPNNNSTQALVLAPTRELGQQIAEQLELFSKYLDQVNVLPVYGGAAISNQMRALKKTQHVIIATPGRLLDLIKRKAVKLNKLQFLVLDEADEMLNMGFKEELDAILSHTPAEKLTWLFSATMPNEIKRIVSTYMDNPIEVRINAQTKVNTNIEHQYIATRASDKTEALMRILDINPEIRAVVFCRTKRDTQSLAEQLLSRNYKADALHGDLSQAQRDRVMKRFKEHGLQVLIATDVAARGIDVNDLTHVFHHSLPDQNEYYTHRSGRTARAGKKGISIAFINTRENGKINRLSKQLGIKFIKIEVPGAEEVASTRMEAWCKGIIEKTTSKKIDESLINKVNGLFSELSKEELIEKILIGELEKLNFNNVKNLNQTGTDKGDRKDRGRGRDRNRREDRKSRFGRNEDRNERKPRVRGDNEKEEWGKKKDRRQKPSGNTNRYFINMGSRDKISKRDLMNFITEVAGIKPSSIGTVDLQGSFSYFEVDAASDKKMGKFKGITLEDGRELRVNRDN